jgi:multiple sugar transport system substrate-binding protein
MKKLNLVVLIIAIMTSVSIPAFSQGNEEKAKEDSQILVWIPGDDVEYSFYYNMFENFKEAKEAKGETFDYVIEQQPWGDYFTKLPLEVNNGRGPDIFYINSSYMATQLPLTRELNLSKDTLSQLNTTDTYLGPNNKPLCIPTVFTSMVMFANEKIVDSDITPPTTWDELLQESQKYNNPEKGVIGFDYSFHILWNFAYQKNKMLTDDNGPVFDRESLETILDWTNKGYVDYLGYGQGSPEDSIYQDSAAFIYGAGWMEFWAPEGAQLYAFPVPGGKVPSNAEVSFGISKNVSEEKYQILNEFVEFMLTDEKTVTDIVKGNSGASNNKTINIDYEPGTAGYAVQQTYKMGNSYYVTVPSGLETIYKAMLESVLIGEPIDQAIEDAKMAATTVDTSNLHKMEQALK